MKRWLLLACGALALAGCVQNSDVREDARLRGQAMTAFAAGDFRSARAIVAKADTLHVPQGKLWRRTLELRMALAFALAGATFQLLDAGFVAFSSAAQMGFGGYSALLRFGPFLVTAGSLVCWAFLFAKPTRTKFLLALLPVLLILLRAVAGF